MNKTTSRPASLPFTVPGGAESYAALRSDVTSAIQRVIAEAEKSGHHFSIIKPVHVSHILCAFDETGESEWLVYCEEGMDTEFDSRVMAAMPKARWGSSVTIQTGW